jgi:arginase
MRLVDGANAILEDLPKSTTTVIDVPLEAGDEQGSGIARYGSVLLVRERTLDAISAETDPVITIGGDCGVSLAGVEHALAVTDGNLAVIWFDAHPDLNTPETSPSGAFGGMVLRTLLGDGSNAGFPSKSIAPERVVLAGTRSIDPGEESFLSENGLRPVLVEKLDTPKALLAAIKATGASSVYIHIDLDVLDPAELGGLSYPLPFGLAASALIDLIKSITAKYPLAGATIAQFAPPSPEEAVDDLPTILRIIGSLTAGA